MPAPHPTLLLPRIVDVRDLSPADEPFVTPDPALGGDWIRLSGLPANAIERAVRVPRLSRYRAALEAGRAARAGAVVISHLPLMTAAVATTLRLMRRHAPHLGFSFNFTTLPTGRRRAYFRAALAGVDQFAVFSQFERDYYANWFDLDPARLVPVIWTQAPPAIGPATAPVVDPYVCAVGGEGRDFAMLFASLRLRPSIRAIIICRPHSLTGLTVPDNATILTNIPAERVWRIAHDSAGVLIPLHDANTCCGHVTLVAAKLLGLPIATTIAHATREYVEGRDWILQSPAGDAAAFAHALDRLIEDRESLRALAQEARPEERRGQDRAIWDRYVADFIRRYRT